MLRLIESSSTGPASLADVKKHCRANDFADDDEMLQVYLDAATKFVSDRCSLALGRSVYVLELSGWWVGPLDVPIAPVRDISITYSDGLGVEQTVSDVQFRWRRTPEGAVVELLSNFTRPAVLFDRRDAVRVEISAGFDVLGDTGTGDDPELTADPRVRQAILLITAHWYENREATLVADRAAAIDLPLAAEAIMGQLRIYR